MQRGVIFRMSNNLTDGVNHDAAEVECSTHFLFIAKNLERVGDHATNIAEVIQFQLSGTWVREARPKGGEPAPAVATR
jgi:phosphate uptake regulator